jgi:hypothetical protein
MSRYLPARTERQGKKNSEYFDQAPSSSCMRSHKSVRYTHMMRNAFAHGSFCSGSFLVTCMAMVNEGMMHVMCSRAKHRSEKAWPSGESGERVFALFAPVVRVQPALADVGHAYGLAALRHFKPRLFLALLALLTSERAISASIQRRHCGHINRQLFAIAGPASRSG